MLWEGLGAGGGGGGRGGGEEPDAVDSRLSRWLRIPVSHLLFISCGQSCVHGRTNLVPPPVEGDGTLLPSFKGTRVSARVTVSVRFPLL